MKSHIIIFTLLLFAAIFAVYIGIGIHNKEDSMLRCNDSELSSYNKDVFINGEQVDDKLSVVIYHSKIYFSVDMLRNRISGYFISQCGNSINIRRNEIDPLTLLKSESYIYVEFDVLMQYVHVNNDVYKSSGSMYIDSMLPASVNINGARYYITNEQLSSSVFGDNLPDVVLSDGRGAWSEDDCFYIEDDWGNVYRYRQSQNTIS